MLYVPVAGLSEKQTDSTEVGRARTTHSQRSADEQRQAQPPAQEVTSHMHAVRVWCLLCRLPVHAHGGLVLKTALKVCSEPSCLACSHVLAMLPALE